MNLHSPVLAGMADSTLFMLWSRSDQIRFSAVRAWRINQGIGGFFGTFLGPSQESTAVRAGHGRSESDWISAFPSFFPFKKMCEYEALLSYSHTLAKRTKKLWRFL